MASLLCGIFVGGQSRRMGGHPKGLLPAPEAAPAVKPAAQTPAPDSGPLLGPAPAQTLVARLAGLATAQGLPVVLVGTRPEYAGLGLPLLADRPPGHGPLGGLAALLLAATESGHDGAIALSCDLPFLGAGLLGRLIAAPAAAAVAPRWQPADRDAPIWEPLCARYSVTFLPRLQQAMAQGLRSLQPILSSVDALPLSLTADETAQLRDWDRPDDLPAELRARLGR